MIRNLSKTVNRSSVLMFFLMLLNFIVKGYFISYNSINSDEAFSIFHAKMNLGAIFQELSNGNNPPLYEVLLHFWIKIAGTSSAAVRFPSLLCSTLSVYFIYQIGKQFFNSRIAVFTSLLFIFSSYQIAFAHETRVYALLGLLSVMSMYYLLRIIKGKETKRLVYIFFILTNTLMIYAHYFGFFILFVQLLFVLFNKEVRIKNWKNLLLSSGVIFVLYLPNMIVFFQRFLESSTHGTWVAPVQNLGNLHRVFHQFSNENTLVYLLVVFVIWMAAGAFVYKTKWNMHLKFFIILILLPLFLLTGTAIYVDTPEMLTLLREDTYVIAYLFIVSCFVIYVVFHRSKTIISLPTKLIVFWFWFPLLSMFVVSLDFFPYTIPMFIMRYLMMISIAFYFFVAVSLDRILKPKFNTRNQLNFILPLLLLFLFIFTSQPNISNKRNVFQAVEKVKNLQKDNSLVLFSPIQFNLNFTYYYDYTYFVEAKTIKDINQGLKDRNVVSTNNIKYIDIPEQDHLIYLDAGADFSYPDNNIISTLKEEYTLKSKQEVYEIYTIYDFEKADDK